MVKRVFPLLCLLLSFLPCVAPRPASAFTGVSISAYSVENWIGPTTGVELRLFLSNALTTPEGNTYPASEPRTGVTAWRFACTVTSASSGGVTVYTVNIPSITIQATTNATVGQNARYYAYFFRSTGVLIAEWKGFQSLRIPNSPASTTWQAIRIYNADTVSVTDNSTYTKTEIDALLVACCSGSTNYYNTIQEEGANLTQRPTLNAGSGVKAVDNAGSTRTDLRTDGVPTEWVNVKTDYGAVGDGVANDTTAIQNAITAASGKTVYFPKGTYKVTSLLTLASNITYRGEGAGTVINLTVTDAALGSGSISNIVIERLKFTGSARRILSIAGTAITIRDCEFSGATLDPTGGSPAVTAPIYIGQSDDVTIERNRFTSNGYSSASIESAEIYVAAAGSGVGSRRIKIRNNYVVGANTKFGIVCFDCNDSEAVDNYVDQGNGGTSSNANGYGILFYATASTTTIARNKIEGNVVRNSYGSGIYSVNSYYTVISGNRLYDTAKSQSDATLPVGAISVNGSNGSTVADNTIQTSNRNGIAAMGDVTVSTFHSISITGNTINGAAGEAAINLRNICRECVINANTIAGGARGIYSASSITQTGLRITDNSIYDPSSNGIHLDTANDSLISGNRVFSPGAQGILVLAGSRDQISFNEVKDSSSSGYDIRCSSSVISGNLSDNNTAGDYSDSGSNNWWVDNKYIVSGAEKVFAGALNTSTGTGAQTLNWGSTLLRQFTFGAGDATFTFSNGSTNLTYTLIIIQDGTGGRSITWPGNVKWTAATAPTLTTAANAKDVFTFVFDGTNFQNTSKMLDVR